MAVKQTERMRMIAQASALPHTADDPAVGRERKPSRWTAGRFITCSPGRISPAQQGGLHEFLRDGTSADIRADLRRVVV